MHNQERGGSIARRGLTLGVVLMWLAGCYPPSALEMDYGNSVHNNMAQSVLNPQAAFDTTPPVGLPPQAVANEKASYDKSFTAKPQKEFQGMQTQSSGSSGY